MGSSHRAKPSLVLCYLPRQIQSLPRNADCHKLLHFALYNLSDDKRYHSFKSSFYFFEYSERAWVCPHCASACQPLVLSFYVAAYRAACGGDYKQDKAEKIVGNDSSKEESQPQFKVRKIISHILLFLACAYGVYAFIDRGVWKYLILKQQFFFFDLERGYILFAMDYISIIILFATISHFIAKLLKK